MINELIKENHKLFKSVNGDDISITKFIINGEKPGPTVYFQASLHGAELQGNLVIHQLIEYFTQNSFSGSIELVPFANPLGANHKTGTFTQGRFDSITGENWNRLYFNHLTDEDIDNFINENKNHNWAIVQKNFKDLLNKKLAATDKKGRRALNHTLQSWAHEADFVFDLHTGPIATEYLYVPTHLREKSLAMNFPHMLIIPLEFAGALDEATAVPWHRLSEKASLNEIDWPLEFESYTVELGSEEVINSKQAEIQAARILHYLAPSLELTETQNIKPKMIRYCELEDYYTYYSPCAALAEYLVAPGQSFKKDEPLVRFFNINGAQAPTTLNARADGVLVNHCPSGLILEGMELLQVMENYQEHL